MATVYRAELAVCVCLLHLVLLAASVGDNAAGLECPFGRVLSTCYTGCPGDCDTSTPRCETCASGCFCPHDLVQFDSELCVEPEQCVADFTGIIPPIDKCSQYGSCDECISSDPDCQWCPFEPTQQSVKGTHCRHRDLNPICPEMTFDPQSSVTPLKNDEFTDNVQIRPQRLKLKLRAGQPEQFTLQFRPSKNFPLDVYFFLDVTGSFSRRFSDTVTPLATELVEALQNISERYAAGFGVFGEKRATPYALPNPHMNTYRQLSFSNTYICNSLGVAVDDCNPTISFRHTTNLSSLSTEQLQDVLSNISIHLNLDSLEGGMDGLVQALTCTEKIGWRQQSLRMLLYMSNARFHLAGDGKVGAAIEPNPGECYLEDGEEDGQVFQEYNKDTLYDYPSVYQLRQLILRTQTNVVFAISGQASITNTYEELKGELGLGPLVQLTTLEADSSNIVSVIQSSYDDITQEIRLSLDEEAQKLSQLSFSFSAGEGCTLSADGGLGCSGVALDTTVSLIITVTMTTCLPNDTVVSLRSAAGSVELVIEPQCQCDCSVEEEPAAEECNGVGTLQCGVCLCDEGWRGDECECEGDTDSCGPGLNGEECSGSSRGDCECGTCNCYVQEELLRTLNITEPYFGDQCQCDHFTSCGGISEDGMLCSGRGVCDCETDTCLCSANYTGEMSGRPFFGSKCQCNPDFCYNENFPNRQCVYTGSLEGLVDDAPCGCDVCQCDHNGVNALPAGDGTCKPGPDLCTQNEDCARCAKNPRGSSIDCGQCDFELIPADRNISSLYDKECTYRDGGCTHTFYIPSSTLSNVPILVEEGEECDRTGGINPLVWIIPVSVVGALLVLGILLLLIVLLVIWKLDQFEFRKFQSGLEDADWVPQENPIYVSPQQEYPNIAYKRSSRRKQ